MTNPETRKSRQAAAAQKLQNQVNANNVQSVLGADEMECITPTWNAAQQRRDAAAQHCIEEEEDSLTPTPDSDDDLDEEGELSLETCSSFSLQECIDEFKARRMRRISTHSRDIVAEKDTNAQKLVDPAEEDLINQNRCNKEQERKCKPCKNGFCYCFTSDSGDAMVDGAERAGASHMRQTRRSRKSESSQPNTKSSPIKERRQQSAPPAGLKSSSSSPNKRTVTKISSPPLHFSKDQITAISRLETSSKNAPLIHIIQELHNNCVISEVRVNKHKMQAQRSRSLSSKPSPKKTHFNLPEPQSETTKSFPSRSPRKSLPTAPPLDKISELDSLSERFVYSTSLNSSAKSANDSPGRRHKAAGLLLQKRLSQTHTQYKPRNLNKPPPKPPRCSFNSAEDKTSVSTLASTTPSLREAERVLDDFLRSKGVALPGETSQSRQSKDKKERANEKAKKQQQQQQQQNTKAASNREKRKSYPLSQPKTHLRQKPLPSCPSLSDIERMVDDTKKPATNYEKNIRHFAEKPIKEHSFSWKEPEPDIHQMLNYDANANKRKFRSQAVQAEPQTIGWRLPPKLALDTVDGEVRSNLAANISKKTTPVKTPLNAAAQKAEDTQKFLFTEQLKSFVQSPWSNKSNKKNDATVKKPKSSLKSTSRNFLNNSKKRILKLVSPKKDNREPRSVPFAARRTPLRSVGIQTSREELRTYETSSTPQSPPGSYFSAVQTSQQSSSTPTQDTHEQPTVGQHFDFNRKVHSPPKKPKAAIHRKLNFPLSRNDVVDDGSAREHDEQREAIMTKTYRSFNSDLDQDVLSKMGYILSNIRSKLKASDEHAMRTFQDIERREQQVAEGFDYPDSAPPQMRHQTRVDLHRNHRNFAIVQTEHDPIYSEIEEDSLHVSSSPHFDNKTGIEHFPAALDPNVLYAKVTKRPTKPSRATKKAAPSAEQQQLPSPSTSLAQCMRDSLKSKITLKPLPPLPATEHYAASMISASSGAPHTQSLNNIRVMEHNSPPKRHRHLSKSDLSLQRSEIFLENLCRSEIIINAASLEPLEKSPQHDESSYISINSCGQATTQRDSSTRTFAEHEADDDDDDDVSYELPHEAEPAAAAGSQLGLGHIEPPHSTNQSTPKKATQPHKPQTFMTKPALDTDARQKLSLDISIDDDCLPSTHQSSSCPNTPRHLPAKPVDVLDNECATSLIEVSATASADKTLPNNKSALARYQRLKNVLRKSLRKSKKFVKTETKRLSSSLSFPAAPTSTASMTKLNQSELQQCEELLTSSSLNLDSLFSLDGVAVEEQPLQQQLAKAVCICRQLPDLEISPEMVEAERLLLFSTLRRDASRSKRAVKSTNSRQSQNQKRFYVDAMRLPIRTDASQDLFFNYFYIGTFYCDGVIRSTQSVECRNHEAIFSDCGIEFACSDEAEVKCEIFMLRLRKVSTISLEPTKKSIVNLLTTSRSSVGSSCDDIVSRFRLHGSFTITSQNFVPYEYVELASKSSNSLCLRSSTSCKIAITPRTQSTNLATEMLLTGRAEVRFPKLMHSGFLNVQQPENKHHWNRRWCTLDGVFVRVWQDMPVSSDLNESELPPPLMEFDLRIVSGALECATREQCARPRSFGLDCCVSPAAVVTPGAEHSTVIFFVADTQTDLNAWLLVLNKVVHFIHQWMK